MDQQGVVGVSRREKTTEEQHRADSQTGLSRITWINIGVKTKK